MVNEFAVMLATWLLRTHGELGHFLGHSFIRDSHVLCTASVISKASFMVIKKKKMVHVELGDMS